jgi:energy-coupling factor transport system permease protein
MLLFRRRLGPAAGLSIFGALILLCIVCGSCALGFFFDPALQALEAVFQVGLCALTLLGWAASAYLGSLRNALGKAVLYLAIVAVCAAANALCGRIGPTLLFSLGPFLVSAEALVYGALSGLMIVSVLAWFDCLNRALSPDAILELLGARRPTLALFLSLVLGFIPRMLERYRRIRLDQQVAFGRDGKRLRAALGRLSTLMDWMMEDGLATSASMRARGYLTGAQGEAAPHV